MSAFSPDLTAHLASGTTTLARAWAVTRADGVRLGFTDHDRDLAFDGLTFRADTGLSAQALEQATGLSVDNTEALGALSDAALTEADIDAGRYDDARVTAWVVNWADVAQRAVLFRGTLGEITRTGAAFRAELRGLAEALNRPQGRVFQAPCSAVLGDAACGFDTGAMGFFWQGALAQVTLEGRLVLTGAEGFAPGWFQRGRVTVLSGIAAGLTGIVKRDTTGDDGLRWIELWTTLRAPVLAGDTVRVEAGCDKRFATCRAKFGNTVNFLGFPDIPSEDWVALAPGAAMRRDGGSRR